MQRVHGLSFPFFSRGARNAQHLRAPASLAYQESYQPSVLELGDIRLKRQTLGLKEVLAIDGQLWGNRMVIKGPLI